ncbi:hypothetical protein FNF27_02300 [Cafeteria roenbergensis]|uniref:Uncharacterized protein n=1 Tax=Cafeteria roenbergensis TaxID=33653 RepID=A0A5A8EEC4_CAFRO|nr:hypothetical protein FNF27_02300 [Cafeteria roenbergensis]
MEHHGPGALEFKDGPKTPLTSSDPITRVMDSPAPEMAGYDDSAEDERRAFIEQERKATRASTYAVMFLLGLGVLMPWNCVLLALDYFTDLYHGDTFVDTASSPAYTWPQLVTLVISTLWCQRVHFRFRITTQFIFLAFILGTMPFVADWGVEWVLASFAILGISTSFLQSAAFAFASVFPGQYMGAFFTAQAYAGLFTSILRIMTKVLMPEDKFGAVLIYFGTAMVVQLLCAVAFEWQSRHPLTQAFVHESVQARAGFGLLNEGERVPGLCNVADDSVESEALLAARSGGAKTGGGHAASASGSRLVPKYLTDEGEDEESAGLPAAAAPQTCFEVFAAALCADETKDKAARLPPSRAVTRDRWLMLGWVCGRGTLDTFNIFLVFAITFVPLPNMILRTNSQGLFGPGLTQDGWWPILILTLFNAGDAAGRYLAEKFGNCCGRWYTMVTLLRSLTIIGFWACQYELLGVNGDWVNILSMVALSMTNGWCSATAFGSAPTRISEDYGPQLGSLTATGLVYGIASGAAVSIPIANIKPGDAAALLVTGRIVKGQVLLEVPADSLILPDESWAQRGFLPLESLALSLLEQCDLGQRSKHAEYIESLPSASENALFLPAACGTDAARSFSSRSAQRVVGDFAGFVSKCLVVATDIPGRRATRRFPQVDGAWVAAVASGSASSALPIAALRWAYATVLRRAFTLERTGGGSMPLSFLAPGADLLEHEVRPPKGAAGGPMPRRAAAAEEQLAAVDADGTVTSIPPGGEPASDHRIHVDLDMEDAAAGDGNAWGV